jgi:hypothetical protein
MTMYVRKPPIVFAFQMKSRDWINDVPAWLSEDYQYGFLTLPAPSDGDHIVARFFKEISGGMSPRFVRKGEFLVSEDFKINIVGYEEFIRRYDIYTPTVYDEPTKGD